MIERAENGVACIDMLTKQTIYYSLILMDIQMPTGYEASGIRELKDGNKSQIQSVQ